MNLFASMSVKNKIILIILIVSFIVIFLSAGAISYIYITDKKESTVYQSKIKARLIGDYSIPSLTFNYPDRAVEILQKLENDPTIERAEIYSTDFTLFASYPPALNNTITLDSLLLSKSIFNGDYLDTYETIMFNEERYGYIHLRYQTGISKKLRQQISMVFLLLAGVMLVAIMVARRLQSIISNPLIDLSKAAQTISKSHDYGIRVKKINNDEIGELYDNFNALLAETQLKETERNEAMALLREHKDNLEQKVRERTDTLLSTQKELIDNAHKAGMADIASGALHNVGNILNSIKTSASLINEYHNNSGFKRFSQANKLLSEHIDSLEEFILNDSRGKKLLLYYLEIEKMQTPIDTQITNHISRLIDKVNTSVDVIHSQQSYASSASLTELYNVCEVIEDGLSMESSSIEKQHITIVKNFDEIPEVLIQRTKLIHIFINLINNAKEAMANTITNDRTLKFNVFVRDNAVLVKVSDSGHGIPEEIIKNVFSHGFTTKKSGHGFGLHSCANYMTEMGGTMSVNSGDILSGATFTLEFPISSPHSEV